MRLLFDLEADGLLHAEGKPGEKDYKAEATKIHCLVIKNLDTGVVLSCAPDTVGKWGSWKIIAGINLLMEADEVSGHNILTYDLPLIRKLYPKFQLKPTCKIIDTLTCSRLIWTDIKDMDFKFQGMTQLPGQLLGSHSLEAWGYRLGLRKGVFAKNTDWSTWSQEMQTYCELDVEVNVRLLVKILSKSYSPEALQLEHNFQSIIHQQEESGFGFDVELAQKVYATMAAERDKLKRELQEVFPARVEVMKTPAYWTGWNVKESQRLQYDTKGAAQKDKCADIEPGPLKTKTHPFNPDSGQQVAARLTEKYGWKPTAFTASGLAKIDEEILSDLPFPEAKLLADYAILVKRIGQVAEGDQGWLQHVRNGRLYGSMITNGAVTGRCTHRLVVNVPKHPAPWGKEMRSMFIPTKDWWLVGCDASGLEARCQGHFMEPYDDGALIRAVLSGDKSKGTDVHSINRDALGLEPTSNMREVAKTWYYAFIYGAGNFKSGSIVGVSEEDVERFGKADGRGAEQARKWLTKNNLATTPKNIALHVKGGLLKKRFLDATPALAQLIQDTQKEARMNGFLVGLDGRLLNIRAFYSALNTLLQSAGALVMKKALCLFMQRAHAFGWEYGKDFRLVANVHDEIQAEAPNKALAEEIGSGAAQCIKDAGEHFKFRCPLAGEFKVGKNWHETH